MRRLLHFMKKLRAKCKTPEHLQQIALQWGPLLLRSRNENTNLKDKLIVSSVAKYLIQEAEMFYEVLQDPEHPNLVPGEKVLYRAYRVIWDYEMAGDIWITNFRLIFQRPRHTIDKVSLTKKELLPF